MKTARANIVISVACLPTSTVLSANPVSTWQDYALNEFGDPTFTFPKVSTTEPNCPITYTINPSPGNTFMDPFVYNWNLPGDNFVIVPNRRNLLSTYKFSITATAEGGATITMPEYTLNTVCGPASFDTTTSFSTIGTFSRTLT